MTLKKATSRAVSKKGIMELMKNSNWTEDDELNLRLNSHVGRLYRHPNGQLLFVDTEGNGRLHHSRDKFILILDTMPKKPQHVLYGRFPQSESFPTQVTKFLEQLPSLLKLPPEAFDFTDESLGKVEDRVKKIGKTACLEAPIFPALVAYIGEIIRVRVNGEWRMRLTQDGETWEPWIVGGDSAYNPFLDLYKVLYEERGVHLQRIASMRLNNPSNPPGLGIPVPYPKQPPSVIATIKTMNDDP